RRNATGRGGCTRRRPPCVASRSLSAPLCLLSPHPPLQVPVERVRRREVGCNGFRLSKSCPLTYRRRQAGRPGGRKSERVAVWPRPPPVPRRGGKRLSPGARNQLERGRGVRERISLGGDGVRPRMK